eukprot:m.22205 g.22205  ORF g.22205 m.22205 type:complete len:76 (+) comp13722_c0_seq1:1557-1784(+)
MVEKQISRVGYYDRHFSVQLISVCQQQTLSVRTSISTPTAVQVVHGMSAAAASPSRSNSLAYYATLSKSGYFGNV